MEKTDKGWLEAAEEAQKGGYVSEEETQEFINKMLAMQEGIDGA